MPSSAKFERVFEILDSENVGKIDLPALKALLKSVMSDATEVENTADS